VELSAYDLAQRFIGLKEVSGAVSNPQILAMLRLDETWPGSDEVPWCSAFVNYVAWLLRLPRSKSLAARSWLEVGTVVPGTGLIGPKVYDAQQGYDVVVLSRGNAGHVGFFSSFEGDRVWLLGGNQDDSVSLAQFEDSRILGVRRLA